MEKKMERIYVNTEVREFIDEKWDRESPMGLYSFGENAPVGYGVLIPYREWQKYQRLKKAIIKLGVEVLYDED